MRMKSRSDTAEKERETDRQTEKERNTPEM